MENIPTVTAKSLKIDSSTITVMEVEGIFILAPMRVATRGHLIGGMRHSLGLRALSEGMISCWKYFCCYLEKPRRQGRFWQEPVQAHFDTIQV
jgi:hypothetical protein